MRLIDADALKKQIEDFHCKGCDNYNFVRCRACWVDDTITYLEEAPTVGGWISVKDRLPTYAELRDDHVLVLFDDGTICSTEFDECIEGESIFGEWRQNFDMETLGATDSYWMPFKGVTHWMPLPEPPEEGEHETEPLP